LTFFEKANKSKARKVIDNDTFDLVCAVISTNMPLAILENVFVAKCFKMELSTAKTFRNSTLPRVFIHLHNAIEKKLEESISMSLITDIWTNKVTADFLALAALIVNKFKKQELIVLGMKPMNGNHTAESFKIAVEDIVNE